MKEQPSRQICRMHALICVSSFAATIWCSSVSAQVTVDQNPVPEFSPYTISWSAMAQNWCDPSTTWNNYRVEGRGTFYTANHFYQYPGTVTGQYTHDVYRKQCYSTGWYYAYVGGITVTVEEPSSGPGTSFEYKYDALGRLETVIKDGETVEDYDYDPSGNRESATSGTPAAPNNPPVANSDWLTVPIFEVRYKDVVANDTDADGDFLTIVSVTQPWNAIVSITTSNTLRIRGTGSGSSTIFYTIEDGNGGSDTGTVSLTVSGGGGGGYLP